MDKSFITRLLRLVHDKPLRALATFVAAYLLWKKRAALVPATAIALYGAREKPPAVPLYWRILQFFARAIQRLLIDNSKEKLAITAIHPTDSIRNPAPVRTQNNGHGLSGAVRDAARIAISECIATTGLDHFEINPSKHSTTGPRHHLHFAVGDLDQDMQVSTPGPNSVIVGIDIDYYIKDPDDILQYGRPVILHTFNPIAVSGTDCDSPFTITGNEIAYKVSGGGQWEHSVWDWCAAGEFICSRAYQTWKEKLVWLIPNLLGFRRVIYHKIHHARPWTNAPHRALVYTIPQYRVIINRYLPMEIGCRELLPVHYQDNNHPAFNRLEFVKDNIMYVSIGRQGELAQTTIPLADMDILCATSTPQSVASRLIQFGHDSRTIALVQQYVFGKSTPASKAPLVVAPLQPKAHYPAANYVDGPDISARAYSKPVIEQEAMMPMIRRWEALSESLDVRVTFVANNKLPSDHIAALTKDFVEAFCKGFDHSLLPLSLEDTIDRLTKPSQSLAIRQILDALDFQTSAEISSFIKNEPTKKPARIISGFADIRFIIQLSRYTFVFNDAVMKSDVNKFYCFPGRNCKEVEDGVLQFVADCGGLVSETDYSNMDGTVSEWQQLNIAQACMLRTFHHDYHSEIRHLMHSIIHCPAKSKKFGFAYEPGVGVKSGSPTTTQHNTIYNSCIEAIAIKMTLPNVTMDEALHMIGPKFGDDGLVETRFATRVARVAKSFGMEIKVEHYDYANGLSFLGRVYIDPMSTHTNIADPLRTLAKLHLTTRDPSIPIADAATDRVEGYLVTDKLTPIISEYCQMIKRVYAPTANSTDMRETRKSHNREKPYWLTEGGGAWSQLDTDRPIMVHVIARRCGFTVTQVNHMDEKFRSMQVLEEFDPLDATAAKPLVTIDAEGFVPDVVSQSFTKHDANVKDRARLSVTRRPTPRTPAPAPTGLPRRTSERQEGPRQPNGMRPQGSRHPRPDGVVTTGEAQRKELPDAPPNDTTTAGSPVAQPRPRRYDKTRPRTGMPQRAKGALRPRLRNGQ